MFKAPAVGLLVASLAVLSACGGSSSKTSASGSDSGDGGLAAATKRLDALYAGVSIPPLAKSPVPAKNKSVWIISYGQSFSFSATETAAAKEAAEKLGWKVTVFDAKGDPSAAVNGLRQAVAAKANGVYTEYFDCTTIKAGLLATKKAGIPVAADESKDCDTPLFDHVVTYSPGYYDSNKGVYPSWLSGWSAAMADYVIVKTKAKAKVIMFKQTDVEGALITNQGFVDQLKSCSTCKVVDTVEFTNADYGPALQAKAEQALLKHPEANAIKVNADNTLTSSVLPALRSSGRLGKVVIGGGEGSSDIIPEVKKATGYWAESSLPVEWSAYDGIDSLNRIFNGEKPAEFSGIGFQILDKDHLVVPLSKGSELDFRALYAKAWGVA